ncbi:MAG: TlpA family protein disulfide reductase [Dehalococcoidia bacterium]|nr:TlpA family protein disulfide reductase [Dehalococcoidia bacterium]
MRLRLLGLLLICLPGVPLHAAPEIGTPAPALRGTLFSGEEFDLARMRGQVVLVNFFSSYCKHCAYEIGNVETFLEQNRDRGFVVLVIGVDRPEDRGRVEGRPHGDHEFELLRDLLLERFVSRRDRHAVAHRGIRSDDAPDRVALERGRCHAEACRDAREGAQIVIDDHLAGDPDDPPVGGQLVGLLRLSDRAIGELALLVDLLERRRLAELHGVDVLEVGGGAPAGERQEGPRIGLVGLAQGFVGDIGQDRGKVRGRERELGDIVARHAAGAHARGLETLTGEIEQRQPGPVPAEIVLQREERRVVTVEQRRRDPGAARVGLVARNHGRRAADGRLLAPPGQFVERELPEVLDAGAALDMLGDEFRIEPRGAADLVQFQDAGPLGQGRSLLFGAHIYIATGLVARLGDGFLHLFLLRAGCP